MIFQTTPFLIQTENKGCFAVTKKIISILAVTILLLLTIVYAATTGSIQMSFGEFITGLFDANTAKKFKCINNLQICVDQEKKR